jgi:hypothetical protein
LSSQQNEHFFCKKISFQASKNDLKVLEYISRFIALKNNYPLSMRNLSILFFALLLSIASCSKTEDITIKDNVPPPDGTIDSTTIDIYINKCYINILGREPVGNEKSAAKNILSQNNFSVADRKQFLQTFYTTNEYKRNQYNVTRNDYLRNVDSVEVYYQKLIFENLITQPQYAPFYDLLSGEIARLNLLLSINNDMATGTLDYKGMLKRCTYNYFYDQINMGTENFVVSTYQNFLFRYPIRCRDGGRKNHGGRQHCGGVSGTGTNQNRLREHIF